MDVRIDLESRIDSVRVVGELRRAEREVRGRDAGLEVAGVFSRSQCSFDFWCGLSPKFVAPRFRAHFWQGFWAVGGTWLVRGETVIAALRRHSRAVCMAGEGQKEALHRNFHGA